MKSIEETRAELAMYRRMEHEKANPPSCATCRFYLREDDDGGECRRYPPTVPFQIEEIDSCLDSIHSCFPDVFYNQWCGEYERATA